MKVKNLQSFKPQSTFESKENFLHYIKEGEKFYSANSMRIFVEYTKKAVLPSQLAELVCESFLIFIFGPLFSFKSSIENWVLLFSAMELHQTKNIHQMLWAAIFSFYWWEQQGIKNCWKNLTKSSTRYSKWLQMNWKRVNHLQMP